MKTHIYRSEKKADHYLYLSKSLEEATLPEALLSLLGDLELAFELDINETTKLAAADVTKVMSELSEKGFYLQVPPTGYIHPVDQQAMVEMKASIDLPN